MSDYSCGSSGEDMVNFHGNSSNPLFVSYIREAGEDTKLSFRNDLKNFVMEGRDAKNLLTARLTADDPMMKESLKLHKISQGKWSSFNKLASDTVYFCMSRCWDRTVSKVWTNFRVLIVNSSTEHMEKYFVFSDSRSKVLDEIENKTILDMLARDIKESKLSGKKTSVGVNHRYQMSKYRFAYDKRELSFRTELKVSDVDAKWYMVLDWKVQNSEGEEEEPFPDKMIFGSALVTHMNGNFINNFCFNNGEKLGIWLMEPPDIPTLDRTLLRQEWLCKLLLLRRSHTRKIRKLMNVPQADCKESHRRRKVFSPYSTDTWGGARLFRINKGLDLCEIGYLSWSDCQRFLDKDNLVEAMETAFQNDIKPLKPILKFIGVRAWHREPIAEILEKVITMSLLSQLYLNSNVVNHFLSLTKKGETAEFHDLLLTQIQAFFSTEYNHSLSDGMLLIVYFILIKKFMPVPSLASSPILCLVEGVKMKNDSMMLKRSIDEEEIVEVYRQFEEDF